MSNFRKLAVRTLTLSGAIYLAYTPGVQAYLDPGTGSMMLQAIIGSIAAGAVAGRLYWSKIKGMLTGKGKTEAASDDTPAAQE